MENDFNKAVNDFISWYLKKNVEDDISEEEFKHRLEKYKDEIVSGIESFKNDKLLLSNINKNRENPFVIFLLMMFYPNIDPSIFFENMMGRKLSDKEINEYLSLLSEKSNINSMISFFEENDDIEDSIYVAPIVKILLELKNKFLPYLKELKIENQNKINSFSKY